MTTSAIVARCRPIVHAVFGLAFVVATSTARAADYEQPFATGWPRGLREVVTERSLLNAAGTFYVLPRVTSGGAAKIPPVCSHGKRITEFCSWRGLLVIGGVRQAAAKGDPTATRILVGTAGTECTATAMLTYR